MNRLERLWRQIGTGISFALFGVGGLVLASTLFPAIWLIYRDPVKRAAIAQRAVHVTWRMFVGVMVGLRVIDFEVEGAELLQGDSGTLVIANHPSLIDVVLIMSLMRRTQCVVKRGVWSNPFMRGVVRATGYIPNLDDPEKLLGECVAALRSGNNLVLFPEGSRTVPGIKPRMQRGFANIAVRANVPVRLVAVTCTPPTLLKGERWYQSPSTRPLFKVRVCERLEMATFNTSGVPSRAVRDLSSYVTRRFEEIAAHA
ncbi:MAG TPA: 1-acyl-sn-glycerol-3-phosphate acyltransferase [Rhizomicrobium sp.]|jgi:1-acyl-sn-glycerol-3-phosphate acyltransferase|nr:1-acyl-sn-glycerol-3-phosphate acyltransferase [Rhizomicrobium sp.]